MGGKYKFRALKLNHGNFAWRSEQCTRKTRITDVAYHPANNEYVRTKTITKSAVVTIDATPFKLWYRNYYNIDLSKGTSNELGYDKNMSKAEKGAFCQKILRNSLKLVSCTHPYHQNQDRLEKRMDIFWKAQNWTFI